MSASNKRLRPLLVVVALVAVGSVLVVGVGFGASVSAVEDADGTTVGAADASSASPNVMAQATPPENVSEEAFVEPAPEEGDPYFEAQASDGRWISYVNPRDDYRSPYLGDGSGKICVTLLNEEGDVVAGETVPNTSVTVPTGESLEWHSEADPFTVRYPLTDHYERPLDSDQFGTDPDVPQGDGYLDAHCMELHGLPENGTVDYGEVEIEGEHADRIELVGYVQQANDTWNTDVDPIEDAEPYEDAGGWTYHPGGSHGQAVVVLQLDGVDGQESTGGETDGLNESTDTDTDGDGGDDDTVVHGTDGDGDADGNDGDGLPGFGAIAAIAAVLLVACGRTLRARREDG